MVLMGIGLGNAHIYHELNNDNLKKFWYMTDEEMV